MIDQLIEIIAQEVGCQSRQVAQTIDLFAAGGTVPFIARYRKEATGELDEVAIRDIEQRMNYYRELEDRRQTILKAIEEQGKLSPELKKRILATRQKNELEDLYLPYKTKRRTKASVARERGLEPLAAQILAMVGSPVALESLAEPYIDAEKELVDVEAVLAGAGHILAEDFADRAEARALVRRLTWDQGVFCSAVARGKETEVTKFEMYYDFREPLKDVPSHRMLAMRRGEKEEILRLKIEAPEEEIHVGLAQLVIPKNSCYRDWLVEVVRDSYQRLISSAIEVELRLEAKKAADLAAIKVFAENLRHLLLAAPAGSKRVLGIDPGLRTGSKLAVVDGTGRFLAHTTIYPHTGGGKAAASHCDFLKLIRQHQVEMIAVGNGTAGREMEQFARQALKDVGLKLPVVMVSESGASIYSASDIAREEFPDLDLTVRGAISIARRLQDPLAELVKVDPKSIGVGQYQHDVSQPLLKKALDEVVESCVNFVGVELNTASWALLSFVSGLSETQARAIVARRDAIGPFASRAELLDVPRFGAKTFELAAGFLRIRGAHNPLDNSAVHPERYALVERMAADSGLDLAAFIADRGRVEQIALNRYTDEGVGLPTLADIQQELLKPGRDPRETFILSSFREDVTEISDLKEGMRLNGLVTNVAAFGAFVDIGVHQDGLVHVSQLADKFVRDPATVVKVGQQVQVRVFSVDVQRKRIGLSMRSSDGSDSAQIASGVPGSASKSSAAQKITRQVEQKTAKVTTDLSAAFSRAGFKVKGK
ncbi:Tex family protein [Geopsychrobacter electrodiphilus]|uniref:Tex family protein n=1 Tax=Geopsychrobacter electrodiphilus TaxID=225196 RepID=UPI0003711282|nr:Tex family protein [Geopsychrobacter electrodiphilus]